MTTAPEALRPLKRWRLMFFAAWGGAIPAEMVIGLPLSRALKSDVPFVAIAAIAMATFVTCAMLMGTFRCPRCRDRFTAKKVGRMRYRNPFTSKCLNCGFPNC